MTTADTMTPVLPATPETEREAAVRVQRLVGRHCRATLYLGDCLDMLPQIETADAILTDPPYGATACAWDAVIPFEAMWSNLKRICSGAIVLFSSQPFTSALVMSNPKHFRHEWVWNKNCGANFGAATREPMKEHENIMVFSFGRYTYNRQMQDRAESGASRAKYSIVQYSGGAIYSEERNGKRGRLKAQRVPSSIQRFNRETGMHPTQKPVPLMAYLVETYTNPGDTVMDFTMGSGTTGVACAKIGRNFIGIERDATHYKTACDRIAHELDGALL